jgi:outer membrane autotransporter protein
MGRRAVRPPAGARAGRAAGVFVAAFVAAAWPGARALAACATSGTNQTCTNSVFLSGGATGIQDTATLTATNTNTGTITGTTNGISAVNANVNNAGTISGTTSLTTVGINTTGTATVINSGNINSGQFPTVASTGIAGSTVNLTNTSSGSISAVALGSSVGVSGTNVVVSNSGSINVGGTGPSSGGTAITGTTVNVTNSASGFITGGGVSNGTAIAGGTVTVNNAGTILADAQRIFAGASAISAATANIVNSGTISANSGNGSVIGILLSSGGSSIFNSGTITGNGLFSVTAIQFGGSGNTLTLGPGSIISSKVLGTGSDTFQLGGTGSDTFNVGNIGAGQQYQGFSVFNKIGTSTWTLTGTGAQNWTISQGTLIGDTNSLQGGAIVNNAALVFSQNFNGTYAGDISGTGTLTKQGGGTLIMSGMNGYTGPTFVNGGTLDVTGSLASSVTVNSGAMLAGNGAIGALNVMSGGTVTPGNFATLTVNGNVTFVPGSVFGVNVNAAGQADKIAATGAAMINGGTVQALAQLGGFLPLTTYTILTATGGITGTFDNVTSNLAFLTPTLSYDHNDVFLTLTRIASFVSEAQTPNERAVAAALDKGPMSNPLVIAVLVQTAPGAQQAFDALSGEIYGSLQSTLVEEAFVLRQELLSRLRQAAYAGAPGELGALAFGGPQLATDDGAPLTYAPAPGLPVKALPGGAPTDRAWTLWAKGLGGWGRADGDGNAASATSNFAGFISGADARFGELMRLGFAAGYTHSSLAVDARASSAGIDSVHAGAYASADLGAFDARGGAAYSFHTIDTTRTVAFPGFLDHTAARFDGATAQVFGEVGHGMTLGRLAAEPFAGVAFVHVDTGSFLESGGVAALSGARDSEDVGYSSLGVRAATMLPLVAGYWLVPRIALAWQHAFGDVTPAAALAFQSTGAAFSTAGVPIARDAALVEGGVDLRLSPRAKLSLNYAGELAAHAQTHSVKGGYTWNF